MVLTDLQGIAQAVVNKARSQGYVVPRDVREELEQAGMPSARWKDVVELARTRLSLRKGRYYYVSPITARMRSDYRQQAEVKKAAGHLIRQYKASAFNVERRSHRRIHFIQPVKVITDDNRELNLLTQDISLTGIRLIGPYDLRGQKVRIQVPSIDRGGGQWCFVVQMLWSTSVGDNLIESGGILLEMHIDSSTP